MTIERTTADERAIIVERTRRTERARNLERTKLKERAKTSERTIVIERARNFERTKLKERAKTSERTTQHERNTNPKRSKAMNATIEKPKASEKAESAMALNKDLLKAAHVMSAQEARFLVDLYYQIQDERLRASGQIRATEKSGESNDLLNHFFGRWEVLENDIKRALDRYSKKQPVCQWMRENVLGIGPVIAAGLVAHIDIKKAPTVGHIWRFAGLDPTVKWEKKSKRPWNAGLKCLCYKAGESFIKLHNKPESQYGQVYYKRLMYEWERNARGELADQAAECKAGKTTATYNWTIGRYRGADVQELLPHLAAKEKDYKPGQFVEHLTKVGDGEGTRMLCPDHIKSRARRHTVKLFLSHLHDWWYRHEFGEAPPLPYPIAHLGHAHLIEAK